MVGVERALSDEVRCLDADCSLRALHATLSPMIMVLNVRATSEVNLFVSLMKCRFVQDVQQLNLTACVFFCREQRYGSNGSGPTTPSFACGR